MNYPVTLAEHMETHKTTIDGVDYVPIAEIENCEKLRRPWINVNKILCKCPYCGAVQCQYRSRRCQECGREVRE